MFQYQTVGFGYQHFNYFDSSFGPKKVCIPVLLSLCELPFQICPHNNTLEQQQQANRVHGVVSLSCGVGDLFFISTHELDLAKHALCKRSFTRCWFKPIFPNSLLESPRSTFLFSHSCWRYPAMQTNIPNKKRKSNPH